MMPLPQVRLRHVDEQRFPTAPLLAPLSHSSTPASMWPSPHVAVRQLRRQGPVSEFASPLSHCSNAGAFGLRMPSPQLRATQALLHSSLSTRLPSSQPSACAGPAVLWRLSPHTLT